LYGQTLKITPHALKRRDEVKEIKGTNALSSLLVSGLPNGSIFARYMWYNMPGCVEKGFFFPRFKTKGERRAANDFLWVKDRSGITSHRRGYRGRQDYDGDSTLLFFFSSSSWESQHKRDEIRGAQVRYPLSFLESKHRRTKLRCPSL
jgi:hypothetical protein